MPGLIRALTKVCSKPGEFIATIEKRQGLKVACIEEIAYMLEYIDGDQLLKLAEPYKKNGYGQYLLNVVKNR